MFEECYRARLCETSIVTLQKRDVFDETTFMSERGSGLKPPLDYVFRSYPHPSLNPSIMFLSRVSSVVGPALFPFTFPDL